MKHTTTIGWGKADITPPLGIRLSGQPFECQAEGVESRLTASAWFLNDGHDSVLIASADVLLMTNKQSFDLCNVLSAKTGVPADNIVVTATHTHSGPGMVDVLGTGPSRGYYNLFRDRFIEAATQAVRAAKRAHLYVGSGDCAGYAFNRRYVMTDGTIETHPLKGNPHIVRAEGPDSSALVIFCARDDRNRIESVAVNFGCHATVMERTNRRISSDYPGKLCGIFRERLGANSVPLFLQGACGNICQVNPLDPGRREAGAAWMEKMARALSYRVRGLFDGAAPARGRLRVLTKTISVPRRVVDADLVRWARAHSVSKAAPPDLSDYGVERYGCLEGAKMSLADFFKTPYWADLFSREILWSEQARKKQPFVPVTLKVIAQDNWAMATIPGELFAEFAVDLRARSPFQHTMVVELANGYAGYIATKRAFDREGGYETLPVSTSVLVPEAGSMIVETLEHLLKRAAGK